MSQLESNSVEPGNLPVRKPRSNVFTVMLILSLVFIGIGCMLLAWEIAEYQKENRRLWSGRADSSQVLLTINRPLPTAARLG